MALIRSRRTVPAFAFALCAWCCSTDIRADAPTLSYAFPAGGQRGTKVATTLTGKFAWPVSIDAPGVEITPGMESGKIELTIPADLPTDRIWLRLHHAEGASAAIPFLIGNVRELEEVEPNNSPKKAHAVEIPVTVNGVLKGADVDGFAITLEAGQTLVAAVDANGRLGSPIDAILQVCLPNGTILAENHDDVGLDPRIVYTAKSAGTYVVRLFGFSSTPNTNIALQGGNDCIYRLTLTTGPFVSQAAQLAVPREGGEIPVVGYNLPADLRLPVIPLGGPAPGGNQELEPLGPLRVPTDARWGFAYSPALAGSTRVRRVPWKTSWNAGPAKPETPYRLELPESVTGTLTQPRQADTYVVSLKKGQAIVATLEARSLDLPLDPVLKLVGSNGKVITEMDDVGENRDVVLNHTAGADGDVQLLVADRHRFGGPRGQYLLTVRPESTEFELSAAADAFVVKPDKPTEIVVNITRRNGPEGTLGTISVMAVDLPEGVTCEPVVSEAKGPTAAKVTLKLASAGKPFSGRIRIRGTSTEPQAIERWARTPTKLDTTFETFWLTAIESKPAEPKPEAKPDEAKPAT